MVPLGFSLQILLGLLVVPLEPLGLRLVSLLSLGGRKRKRKRKREKEQGLCLRNKRCRGRLWWDKNEIKEKMINKGEKIEPSGGSSKGNMTTFNFGLIGSRDIIAIYCKRKT